MKIIYTVLIVLFAACKTNDATPTTVSSTSNFDTSKATLLKMGSMVGIGHTVTGTASVYEANGTKTLVLDPYSSQNGPDLRVYLSKDKDATTYLNLGKLQSISGKQAYTIPCNPDISDYKYAIIWCQQFTVLFGRAELQ